MSLLRWDPFADIAQLRDQMNRMFDQSISSYGREPVSARTWAPPVDITETEDAITLHVEVPGINPEDINIQVEGGTITIKGERKFEKEEKGTQFVRTERTYGLFQRSFTLGLPIKQQEVEATYNDGVLTVMLPKAEEVKPKQVQVKVQKELRAYPKSEYLI